MKRDYYQQAKRSANTAKVVRSLQERPKTLTEVCDETGISNTTVSNICKEFRDLGNAHILRYEQRRSTWVPVWSLGPGTDAQFPRGQPPKERREYVRQLKARQEIKAQERRKFDHRRDYRGEIERWACPDLGKLPMVPFARPA